MRRTRGLVVCVLVLLLLLVCAVPAAADPGSGGMGSTSFEIPWSAIGAAGGHMASANFSMEATVGSITVDSAASTNFALQSGFCPGVRALSADAQISLFLPLVLRAFP